MNEIMIAFHPDDSFDIRLKNGMITVPAEPGGYIVSTGMGSGKTTGIRQLIKERYDEGILYCVDTKSEATKMYRWIIADLGVKNNLISDDDVILLHGDKPENLSLYRSHPEILLSKKILITTHARFFRDLIDYFLIYRPDCPAPLPTFDCDFRNLMKRNDIRRFIIFDETPSMLMPFCEFPAELLGVFSVCDGNGGYRLMDSAGIRNAYNRFIKGRPLDFIAARKCNADSLRADVVLNSLPRFYGKWLDSRTDRCGIQFWPCDLIQDGMTSRVLVFEGAGDVLLKGSSRFSMIDIKEKYNTPVTFSQFHLPFKRRSDFIEGKEFTEFMSKLAEIIDSSDDKILLVVWKDTGVRSKDGENDYGECGSSAFVGEMEKRLCERGIGCDKVKVIYYGSSQSKSTNEFMDFGSIILCGDWNPGKGSLFRDAYMSDTMAEDIKLWYFAQLIARIGIRRHDGTSYMVYHSDDIPSRFINELAAYFSNRREEITSPDLMSRIDKRLAELKGKQSMKEDMRRIANYLPRVGAAIESGTVVEENVTLKKLNALLDKPHRKRRDYDPMLGQFRTLGVDLKVECGGGGIDDSGPK